VAAPDRVRQTDELDYGPVAVEGAQAVFDVMEAPDDGLMQAIVRISNRYGRGTARLGLAQKDAEWRMRRKNLSPSFTTRWGDIPAARVG